MDKVKLKHTILILILALVIIFIILKNQDLDFYENYNKAISEPDSVKILKLNECHEQTTDRKRGHTQNKIKT